MSCAKTAEPIELPLDSDGPKEACIRWAQISDTKGQLLGDRTCIGMPDDTCCELCKIAELINLPFGLWTRVGQRKHTVQLYSPGCANMPSHCALMREQLATPGKYD